MSKFLDNLLWLVCPDDGTFEMDNLLPARNLINLLGRNARRMLDIGIVQDELVKLGFELSHYKETIDRLEYRTPQCKYDLIIVDFYPLGSEINVEEHIHLRDPETFEFTYVDGWEVNLIQKIKELINEKVR